MTEKEMSITKDGVVLKGDIVDVVSSPVETVARTADNILRLVENIVGIPTDILNHHLGSFRSSYAEGYKNIPKKRRIEPTLKLGCNVLKYVAFAVEEPEVQKLFAQLLVSASDSEYVEHIHPSYASVINDMSVVDANVLIDIFGGAREKKPKYSEKLVQKSLSNLTRLGLIEWREKNTRENPLDYRVRSLTLYGEDFIKVVHRAK
ncbi:Abi-alpha family protein [Photobacterium damselae]|uniref:Abi-alpha family protein n=1 Tax=Photobacterium damselae TaxID=38293 RepID=UPI00406925C0